MCCAQKQPDILGNAETWLKHSAIAHKKGLFLGYNCKNRHRVERFHGFNNKCNLCTRSARIRQGLLSRMVRFYISPIIKNGFPLQIDTWFVYFYKTDVLTVCYFAISHSEGFCLSDVRRENTVPKRKHYVWFYFHQITRLTPTQSMGHRWWVNWTIFFVTIKREKLLLGLKIITIHKKLLTSQTHDNLCTQKRPF